MKTASVAKKAVVTKTAAPAQPALAVVQDNSKPAFTLGRYDSHTDLVKAGIDPAVLDNAGERQVHLNFEKGLLVADKGWDKSIKQVMIKGRIAQTVALKASDLTITLIFTDVRTYWNLGRGDRVFSFFVAGVAENAAQAVAQLIENNLARGADTFELTAKRVPFFFFELLRATHSAPASIEIGLRHERLKGTGVLSFNPNDIKDTNMQIAGYNFEFDFVTHPTYIQGALEKAKVGGAKLDRAMQRLTLDQADVLKPKQTPRSEKQARMSDGEVAQLVDELSNTMKSVRARAHELGAPKKVRDMVVTRKQPKQAQDGKKKKNGKK